MQGLLAAGGLSAQKHRPVELDPADLRHLIPPFYLINIYTPLGGASGFVDDARVRGWEAERLAPDAPTRRAYASLYIREEPR